MRDFLLARRRILFFLFLVLGSVALRWPALERQIWNLDEGSTTTLAQLILNGELPFRDGADNRTPLVPYLKAAILAVAGDWNMRAIHVTVALMIGLTAVLLWQIGRRLGCERVGVFGALCFFWLSGALVSPGEGLSSHTSWFVIFFSALGFWGFAGAFTRTSRWTAFASGLAFGFSYLAKQPGLLDFGVCLVIVLLAVLRREPAQAWRLLPPLILGFLLPLAGTIAYFAAHGALDDLIFYSWTYNTEYYVPAVPPAQRLAAILVPYGLLRDHMPAALVLAVIAAIGTLVTAVRRLAQRPPVAVMEWLILGWSATGLLSTILSGRYFEHYSIQIIPGFSLACGWVLAAVAQRALVARTEGRKFQPALLATGIAGVLLSFAVPTVYWIGKVRVTDEASNPIIGGIIQERSQPGDRLFVWGYAPETYVFARRLPATRFYYTNWVTGLIPWANVDWLNDTTYAVIPGTPELLRADLERQPPAMILDTGTLRGYLKYPLRERPWLWEMVRRDFVEVDPDQVNSSGARLYQRAAPAPRGVEFPSAAQVDARVTIHASAATDPIDTAVIVGYPAGTTAVELYRDGGLYRRVTCPPNRAGLVIFTVVGEDLPPGEHQLQAVAQGTQLLASSAVPTPTRSTQTIVPEGPPLEYDSREYPPVVATNWAGAVPPAMDGRWQANAPARFVYERPPGLSEIEVEYQLADQLVQDPDKWKTDGLDFAIAFETRAGRRTILLRRHLDARRGAGDHGLQTARVNLPVNSPGRIIILFSPGYVSDPSCDWALIKAVRGYGMPLVVTYRDQPVSSSRFDAPMGYAPMVEQQAKVMMLHAPSTVEFPLRTGMHRLTGVLGLLSPAWNGPKGSGGAMFEIWHLPPDGEPKLLHSQLADPVHNEGHRGLQRFSISLPQPATGALRLVTRPAHPTDNAFNYTYWGELVAREFPAALATPGASVPHAEIEAKYGYDSLEEAGKTVLFAHAPSRLVFPLPSHFARLRGEFGLLANAYLNSSEPTEGARFVVEYETSSGQRTVLWQRDLNPQELVADRGFIPFSVDLPAVGEPGRIILRTAAREGHGYTRAWTFWHGLTLEP